MKARRDVELAAAVLAGVLLTWWLPEAWFGNALLAAVGLALVMAVLAAASANAGTPRGLGARIAAYFFLGTSRPQAQPANALALRAFLASAALVLGLLVGIFLL